jgi:hypothetical protein
MIFIYTKSSAMSDLEYKTRKAEVKVTTVMTHHNIPLSFADHLSPLFKQLFPDSEIAKSYGSAKIKTACILNSALKPHFQADLVTLMQRCPFSLSIDGSNDTGREKMNPLTVEVCDVTRHKVEHKFLDMCTTSGN